MIDLADFFGVSLDYLVLGRETRRVLSDDSKSVARYVDWALADIQSRAGAKSWLMARIGETLAARIDSAVDEAVAEVAALGGIVTDDDMLMLESLSLHTRLLVTHLDYDVIETNPDGPAAGRFTQTIAANLRAKPGRSYEIVLARIEGRSWDITVRNMRQLLQSEFGVTEAQLRRCKFRLADQKIACGNGFYKLDVLSLRKRAPSLSYVLEPYINDEGWLGYVMHPNNETKGDTLYDVTHLSTALEAWNDLWHAGHDL